MKSAIALLAFFSVVVPPRLAGACGNGVELDIVPWSESDTGRIFLSEKDLRDGRPEEAAAKVRRVFPDVRALGPRSTPLALRGLTTMGAALPTMTTPVIRWPAGSSVTWTGSRRPTPS